ncbi:MAG TPA: rhomboid family intramembrane serine protease [Burkholderiaceae bacterium]
MNRSVAVYLLIGLNIVGYLLEQSGGEAFIAQFALMPPNQGFEPWQLVTYAFLHGGEAHIFFNMFGLWMFGRDLEFVFGAKRFLAIYFASVVAAGCTQILVTTLMNNPEPTIGASGGVFGVLLTFAVLFPRRIIVLLLPPIPMPAWLFVTLYGLLELFMGVSGAQANVAHFAHLGGMLGAALMLAVLRVQRHME